MSMSMSMDRRTMDDFKAPAETWASEVRGYEQQKKHAVDEGLVRGQQHRLTNGFMQAQERVFDPLLGRYRDNNIEAHQRFAEEKARIGHLNAAQDIQILREQPFNIVNHGSKLEKLAPGKDPMRIGGHGLLGEKPRSRHGKAPVADTAVDYNILSNIPFKDQHWARPECRPRVREKSPRRREVPAFTQKEFDIVTNKYLDGHEDKIVRDRRTELLEATHKHMNRNPYDPVVQQFSDPSREENARAMDHAREVESHLRAESRIPPCYKGRQTSYYGMISHQANDPDMLKLWDAMEDERKDRYRNRYIVEHNYHAQDIKGDHINQVRQLNRIAPERFEEQKNRGYHIITGKDWGKGSKNTVFQEAFPAQRKTPWDRVCDGRPELITPLGHSQSAGQIPAASSSSRSRRDHIQPDQVSTIKIPSEYSRRLQNSASEPQIHSSAASVRSGASRTSRRSDMSHMRHPAMPPGATGYVQPRMHGTPAAPPAPSIPGSDAGSCYSRPRY